MNLAKRGLLVRTFALLNLLATGQWACAQGVTVTPIIKSGDGYIFVANNTSRGLRVTYDYLYRCDGQNSQTTQSFMDVWANSSAEWPSSACFGKAVELKVLNFRWDTSPQQAKIDNEAAERQAWYDREERLRREGQLADQEREKQLQRRRLAICNVDESGNFVVEKIAYGKIRRECYQWFPSLRAAADEYKEQERRKVEDFQKRFKQIEQDQAFKIENQKMQAFRDQQLVRERAEALEIKRKQEEDRRIEESERASQQQREQSAQAMNEQAIRFRSDPCGAVAVRRATRPPQTPYPPGANAQTKASIDRFNAQSTDQWNRMISDQEAACSASRRSSRPTGPARVTDDRGERLRKEQAMATARADAERAGAQGQETVRGEQRKTKDLQDSNAELLRLLNGGK